MSVALLDSVKRAEGSQGVHTYLNAKLAYMPPQKPRKVPIKTEDALMNVRRALDFYREQAQPFSIKELCDRANVSPSWLYRKGDPFVEGLANEARDLLQTLGKSKRGNRLQVAPPEPELNKPAIARDWLDSQIESAKYEVERLKERNAAIALEVQQNERLQAKLEQDLSHLFKVRELTQATSEETPDQD